MELKTKSSWGLTALAVIFGLLTIKSGGEVIFIDGSGRAAAGNYVPFVLWFNFVMGFFYLVAGVGIWLNKRWSLHLSILIASLTAIILLALGIYILNGGLYETRTVAAMFLRTIVWSTISISIYKRFSLQQEKII